MSEKIIKIPVEVVAPKKVDLEMTMSLEAFKKVADFILNGNRLKPGDNFTIESLDKKSVRVFLK